MDPITSYRRRVEFFDCDLHGHYKLSAALKTASAVAEYDYSLKGLTREFLLTKDMAFLVSQISFKIFQSPREDDELFIRTWENGKKSAQFLRGFEMNTFDGQLMIQGVSGWVLVNPKTRKIYRPSEFPYHMTQLDAEFECLPISKVNCDELESRGERKVRFSDLDANGHVYNAVYADIIRDHIYEYAGQNVYNRGIDNFRINFSNEASYGDTLELFSFHDSTRAVVVGANKDNGQKCFESEIMYSV